MGAMKYVVMTAPEDGGDTYEEVGAYRNLAEARRAAKDEVRIGRGTVECGMPAWAFDLSSAIEAWTDRDDADASIAVVSRLPVEWAA